MAPTPKGVSASPADPEWLALRRKHEGELIKFQQRVDKSHEDLEKERMMMHHRIEAAQKTLLERHAEEEKAFWGNKNVEVAPKPKMTNARGHTTKAVTVTFTNTANAKSLPAKVQQKPQKKVITPSKPCSFSNQVHPKQPPPPINRSAQKKKAVTEIIDLCGSEDDKPLQPAQKKAPAIEKTQQPHTQKASNKAVEPVEPIEPIEPARAQAAPSDFSIPSASLQFFGSSSTNFPTSQELPRMKREESVPSQHVFSPHAPVSDVHFSQRESRAAPSQQPFPQNWPGHRKLDSDGFASSPFLRAFEKKPSTATPQLQSSSIPAFASSATTRDGSQAAVRPSRMFSQDERGKGDGDVEMGDVPQTPVQSELHRQSNSASRTTQTISQSVHKSTTPTNTTSRARLLSPARTQTSVPERETPPAWAHTSFKKPILPASASQIDFHSQHGASVSSRASSNTVPVRSVRQCETPAPSQASLTPSKKRKVEIDLTSDDSDFAPSSISDGEESDAAVNSGGRKKNSISYAVQKQTVPSPKKSKCSTNDNARNANKYGFKPIKNPAEAAKTRQRPASGSNTSSAQSARPLSSTATPQPPVRPRVLPHVPPQAFRATRIAALRANEKLSQLSSDSEAFWTEQAIEEAQEQEERLRGVTDNADADSNNPAVETVGSRFRGMSITPSPSLTGARKTRDEEVEMPGHRQSAMRGREDWHAWTKERMQGDRVLAKSIGGKQAKVEDYDSDLDQGE